MVTNPEEQLAAARGGDPDALDALLKAHQGRIYRFARKMCRDDEDAKDVLQETLLATVRRLGTFRGESSVSTWLYTIARRFCMKQRRRRKSAPDATKIVELGATPEAREVVDLGRGPDEALAGRELEAALEAAIAALEPKYREVLVLRDVEGLAAAEVAGVLGITLAAVKSRLHRARTTVRECVAPALGIGEDRALVPPACPDILALYSKHLEGEVSATLCAEMERHLAGCPRCDARCESLKRTLALCRTLPTPAVPPEVQDAVRRAVDASRRR